MAQQEKSSEIARKNGAVYLYHVTHADNLPGIQELGLLSRTLLDQRGIPFNDRLTCKSAQASRRRFGRLRELDVHDYVPLYFTPITSTGESLERNYPDVPGRRINGMACLEIDLSVLDEAGTLFTDGHLASEQTSGIFNQPNHLYGLGWEVINSPDRGLNRDRKKRWRRAAEVLVPYRIGRRFIRRAYVKSPDFSEEVSSGDRIPIVPIMDLGDVFSLRAQ